MKSAMYKSLAEIRLRRAFRQDSSIKYAYGVAKSYGIDTSDIPPEDIWHVINEYEKKHNISRAQRRAKFNEKNPQKKINKVWHSENKRARSIINKRLENGSFSKDINWKSQGKHQKGSDLYNSSRKYNEKEKSEKFGISYFTVGKKEIEKLIKDNIGKGTAYAFDPRKGSDPSYREFVSVDKPIAIYRDKNGKRYKTTNFDIHYSSKGVHIVPAQPNELIRK